MKVSKNTRHFPVDFLNRPNYCVLSGGECGVEELAVQALVDTNQEYLVECAIEQIPEELSGETLAIVEFPISQCDFLEILRAQRQTPQHYWQSRDNRREYCGLGAAVSINTSANVPLATCQQQLRDILNLHPQGHRLCAFVATAFAKQTQETDSDWIAYPEFSAVIPEITLLREDERYSAVVCLPIAGIESKSKIVRKICKVLEKTLSKSSKCEALTLGVESVESQPSADVWNEQCAKVFDWISKGEIDKLVLARKVSLTLDKQANSADVTHALQQNLGQGYTFMCTPRSGTTFVCQTPESLFSYDGRNVESEALGGSALEVLGSQDQAGEKLQREHAYVVDDLQGKIEKLSDSTVERRETEVVSLPYISHLRTQVSAELPVSVDPLQILDALHPTPAVGVSPSDKGISKILELEQFSRGCYSAPVGVMRQDGCEFAVALRGVLLRERRATLFGGAGLVQGSDPQSEWEEIEGKLAPILSLFKAV